MNEVKFWAVIDKSRVLAGNDYQAQCDALTLNLESEKPEEIAAFDSIFLQLLNKAYDWKLWAAAYIINGGCSDDCFIDFRSWLIGRGKTTFENALNDPDTLTQLQIEPDNWEGLQYCAMKAYKQKTGKDLPAIKNAAKENPNGKEWNEDSLKTVLPKLYDKYSSNFGAE